MIKKMAVAKSIKMYLTIFVATTCIYMVLYQYHITRQPMTEMLKQHKTTTTTIAAAAAVTTTTTTTTTKTKIHDFDGGGGSSGVAAGGNGGISKIHLLNDGAAQANAWKSLKLFLWPLERQSLHASFQTPTGVVLPPSAAAAAALDLSYPPIAYATGTGSGTGTGSSTGTGGTASSPTTTSAVAAIPTIATTRAHATNHSLNAINKNATITTTIINNNNNNTIAKSIISTPTNQTSYLQQQQQLHAKQQQQQHVQQQQNQTATRFSAATTPTNTRANIRRKFQAVLEPPPLYIITPTYRRPEQLAELTRLGYTLKHVVNLLWLVIEDANNTSDLVTQTLNRIGVPYEYLVAPMPEVYKKAKKNKPRGVSNRNRGLDWLRQNASDGVFYFADDDNTYDITIFEQMRYTKKVSMWPVGLVTKFGVSSPIVRAGKLDGFYDGWIGGRKYPVDMAGFAVSVKFLHERPKAQMPYKAGYEEDGFLKSLAPLANLEIELLASDCTEILTWHTQTKKNAAAMALNRTKYHDTNLVSIDKALVRP